MTDFTLQATTRQDVLDDLAEAIGETLPELSQVSSAGNLQKLWGNEWRILISWKDNYSSGLKDGTDIKQETKVNRGLHVNLRVAGERAEEISELIQEYFEIQSKSNRDMPEQVWKAQKKSNVGQVHKTSRGTSWLQNEDSNEDGYVEHQSFVFG